jgi:hypothetical protein
MAFEHEGLEGAVARLIRAAQLPDKCNHELFEMALETQETAKHMAPVDYGDLQDAITLRARNEKGQFARIGPVAMRLNYEIFVNDNHPVTKDKKTTDTKVGDYSRQVHEYMGYGNVEGAPIGRGGKPFMPSQKSVDEGLKHGEEAGGRFIDRAREKISKVMHARLGKIIAASLKALDR